MTSFSEQLSAASTQQLSAQLDAQLRFFSTISNQMLDNASRLVSLNLTASRETVERSSRTVRELVKATDPRDLLVLRTHAEEQVRGLFEYGRELFNISANAQPFGLRTIQAEAPSAVIAAPTPRMTPPAPEPVPAPVPEQVPAVEPVAAAEPVASEPFIVQQEEPIASADEVQATSPDAPAPVAKQRQIAKAAAGKGASKAAAVPQPLAAPVEDKDVASVTRIETPAPKRRK